MENNDLTRFTVDFNDITMKEGRGVFDIVSKIMAKDSPSDKWMLISDIEIESYSGFSLITANFHSNKDICIVDYNSSNKDYLQCFEISCLFTWSKDNGWNIPYPSEDLIISDIDLWKFYWSTGLISSQYLDKRFNRY